MKKSITALLTALALALPIANASAAAAKKKVVVTKTVTGTEGQASRWGYVQVALVVKKTTTTAGTRKTVTQKITAVRVPVYPDHTDRSVFINQQALPMLVQETLTAQFTGGVDLISGATDTSYGFIQSLQAALLDRKSVV